MLWGGIPREYFVEGFNLLLVTYYTSVNNASSFQSKLWHSHCQCSLLQLVVMIWVLKTWICWQLNAHAMLFIFIIFYLFIILKFLLFFLIINFLKMIIIINFIIQALFLIFNCILFLKLIILHINLMMFIILFLIILFNLELYRFLNGTIIGYIKQTGLFIN